jgi:hypothetical protein
MSNLRVFDISLGIRRDISTSRESAVEKTLIWCLLGVISLGRATWSQDKQTGGGAEKAVAALEQQWLQAQKTNNPDLVAPLLADKFVNTLSDGKSSTKPRRCDQLRQLDERVPSTAM